MAYSFDGSNDKIVHGDITALAAAANMSVAFWLLQDAWASADGIMGNGGTGFRIIQFAATDDVDFQDFGNTGAQARVGTTTMPLGAWHHLVVTWDGAGVGNAGKVKMYVDGVVITPTYVGTFGTTMGVAGATSFTVGTETAGGGFFDGKVAHVKVWNTTLTAAQATQEWQSYRPVTTAGLVLWAPYD